MRKSPETLRYAIGPSRLGLVLVAVGGGGRVRAIQLGAARPALLRELRERFPAATPVEDAAAGATLREVVATIDAPTRAHRLALDPVGTTFQRRVWRALGRVAAGETVSYAELARRVGLAGGARAVARACAANPCAIVVPCHRVVRADGAIGGYRWGVARKRALLAREAAA